MRKKAELEKRFETDGVAAAGSDDSDMDDEDKIAEQEEAGKLPLELYVARLGQERVLGIIWAVMHLPLLELSGSTAKTKGQRDLCQINALEQCAPSHTVPLPCRLWQGREACQNNCWRCNWLSEEPAHPRRYSQVPAQLGSKFCTLRSQIAVHAGGSRAIQRSSSEGICWRQLCAAEWRLS